ncbi:adhesion G- coupled receptor F3 [Pelobates cultripes]|uniref:Adhesion G- coupled receptor F3 n=1 Tax=Pelobates cultripes TaxID=61616 RepID=A0AAD1R8U8_PELCU|nr:adhesion G- coupled receptor F3 [Pelobates cultripes]
MQLPVLRPVRTESSANLPAPPIRNLFGRCPPTPTFSLILSLFSFSNSVYLDTTGSSEAPTYNATIPGPVTTKMLTYSSAIPSSTEAPTYNSTVPGPVTTKMLTSSSTLPRFSTEYPVLTSTEYPTLISAEYSGSSGSNSMEFPANSSNIQQLEEWLRVSFWNQSINVGLETILRLQQYVSSVSSFQLNKDEVPLILYILGNVTQNANQSNQPFSVATVLDILHIANHLLNESSWKPAASTNTALGPQMLQCFESILAGMEATNQSFNVSLENIDFQYKVMSCSSLLNQTNVEIGFNVNISLSREDNETDFNPSCMANIMSFSYKSLSNDFPNDYENHKDPSLFYKVNSRILTNTMFLDHKNYHSANVIMSFPCNTKECHSTAICVFWNFTLGKWSSEGCTTKTDDEVASCLCNHLTSFSVLISNILPQGHLDISILDYITNIGLIISVASLVVCISLQMYLMKSTVNLVAYYRHLAILNVSSFLLLSNVSFLGASYIKPPQFLRLCVALTFCTHFSLLAFFCWTLVQSFFLICRLVFVFHHITKKEFMTLSTVLGYVCPMLIAVGTFLYYTPTDNYRRDNVCWLQTESGASLTFTIPTIIIISLNFLVLLVVIKKLLRPSISEGSSEDEEVVKKLAKAIVFCTPQFGLTWAIGIPLLTNGESMFLQYLFVLLNPLQVLDLVKKRLSKNQGFSSTNLKQVSWSIYMSAKCTVTERLSRDSVSKRNELEFQTEFRNIRSSPMSPNKCYHILKHFSKGAFIISFQKLPNL